MSGSANWSMFAFTGDEQVQTIVEPRPGAAPQLGVQHHLERRGSSHAPGFGIKGSRGPDDRGGCGCARIPEEPTWGKGIYKYLDPEGELTAPARPGTTKGADREVGALRCVS